MRSTLTRNVNTNSSHCLSLAIHIYWIWKGSKVFATIGGDAPFSYKFASMIMACTGGGILVPIFINKIPVPLSQDAYPLAILVSFFLHQYVPVLREVLGLSKLFKVSLDTSGQAFQCISWQSVVSTRIVVGCNLSLWMSESRCRMQVYSCCSSCYSCLGIRFPTLRSDILRDYQWLWWHVPSPR